MSPLQATNYSSHSALGKLHSSLIGWRLFTHQRTPQCRHYNHIKTAETLKRRRLVRSEPSLLSFPPCFRFAKKPVVTQRSCSATPSCGGSVEHCSDLSETLLDLLKYWKFLSFLKPVKKRLRPHVVTAACSAAVCLILCLILLRRHVCCCLKPLTLLLCG